MNTNHQKPVEGPWGELYAALKMDCKVWPKVQQAVWGKKAGLVLWTFDVPPRGSHRKWAYEGTCHPQEPCHTPSVYYLVEESCSTKSAEVIQPPGSGLKIRKSKLCRNYDPVKKEGLKFHKAPFPVLTHRFYSTSPSTSRACGHYKRCLILYICVLLISKCPPHSDTSYFWTKAECTGLPVTRNVSKASFGCFSAFSHDQAQVLTSLNSLAMGRDSPAWYHKIALIFYCCPSTLPKFFALCPLGTWVFLLSYVLRCDALMGNSLPGFVQGGPLWEALESELRTKAWSALWGLNHRRRGEGDIIPCQESFLKSLKSSCEMTHLIPESALLNYKLPVQPRSQDQLCPLLLHIDPTGLPCISCPILHETDANPEMTQTTSLTHSPAEVDPFILSI